MNGRRIGLAAITALLTLAAVLVIAALVAADPLSVSTAVSYARAPGATTAHVEITILGVANATYGVEVRGPANETVAVKEVQTNATGVAVLVLELPETYPSGTYTVYVAGANESATATFKIAWPAPQVAPNATLVPGARVAAPNLLRAAAKLGAMVHCRNEVLRSANVTQGELQLILNLTAAGDAYLARANASLAAGNYTAAMRYAQLAIQSYGKALDLQEDIAELLNVSFAACRAVLKPPKVPPALAGNATVLPRNATCKWTPEFYPLMTAFNVTERRIEELRGLLSKLEERGYNTTGLALMLDEASKLVNEGRALAQACNISSAAHKLAEAKKYLGAVSAAIAKLGEKRFVNEIRKAGLDVNETEVEGALKRNMVAEKIAEKVEEKLNKTAKELEEKVNFTKLEKMEKEIRNLEKLVERVKELQARKEKLQKMQKEIINKVNELIEKIRKSGKGLGRRG